jgi:hypothetical protein
MPSTPLAVLYRSSIHPSSILDRIPQRANLWTKINLDDIARLQKLRLLHRIPHARTRARHKDRALLQRSPLRTIRHQCRNLEAQVIDARTLSQVSIYNSLEMQFRGVGDHSCRHDLRAERRVRVEAFGKVPLGHRAGEEGVALKFARGHVVAACVAANVVEGVGFRDVFCVLRDYEAEFAFVVGLVVLGELGDYNGCVVVVETRVGFDKG